MVTEGDGESVREMLLTLLEWICECRFLEKSGCREQINQRRRRRGVRGVYIMTIKGQGREDEGQICNQAGTFCVNGLMHVTLSNGRPDKE